MRIKQIPAFAELPAFRKLSFFAANYNVRYKRKLRVLFILALLIGMSQFNTLIHTIEILFTAFIQFNKNVSTIVSPSYGNPGILHLLLCSNHLCYIIIKWVNKMIRGSILFKLHFTQQMLTRETNWYMGPNVYPKTKLIYESISGHLISFLRFE